LKIGKKRIVDNFVQKWAVVCFSHFPLLRKTIYDRSGAGMGKETTASFRVKEIKDIALSMLLLYHFAKERNASLQRNKVFIVKRRSIGAKERECVFTVSHCHGEVAKEKF